MKKILSTILCLALMAGMLTLGVQAAAPSLKVDCPESCAAGETITVDIVAEGINNCCAVAFHMSYDPELMEMTARGLMIYSVSFLFIGFNMFGSSMFTALNNGLVSAVISFLRTLVFQVAAILLLPALWELDGIWWANVAAELASLEVTAICFVKYRKRYQYA